ncbi:uncharacterized protein LOC116342655 [Contarinia nasturtii]|uniref:uncharacterized protein LOC116342655 n=1 Tax=Contarinia nasturtii TaxID=265458 RepID=UPI0012D4A8C5|nr:uncharacterized protein LOC116342655 [Contarinia nasturtii]
MLIGNVAGHDIVVQNEVNDEDIRDNVLAEERNVTVEAGVAGLEIYAHHTNDKENEQQSEVDMKPHFAQIQLSADDEMEFDHLFNEDAIDPLRDQNEIVDHEDTNEIGNDNGMVQHDVMGASQNMSHESSEDTNGNDVQNGEIGASQNGSQENGNDIRQESETCGEVQENNNGPVEHGIVEKSTTVKLDDDIEVTFVSPAHFQPIVIKNGYEIKANDMLSNNIPFKRNDKGDRAFQIRTQNGLEEITLSARAVNGLIKLNENRDDEGKDKTFLKALLIGIYTLKRIKESTVETIDRGVLEFVKDLFAFRVSNDPEGTRLGTFEDVVNQICDEIRSNLL